MTLKLEEKSLEKLEQEITCSVCQEYYTEPKVLPCLKQVHGKEEVDFEMCTDSESRAEALSPV